MKISSVLLEGERIVLKNIEKDDIDRVFDLVRQYPDIDKLFPMSLISEMVIKTHFDAGDFTENNNDVCLLISDKQGNIIGSIAYFKGKQCDKNSLELAYHIFRPVHRGKGYMTETLCLLTTYLFETVKIPRLQINIIKGNISSRKVAEKCGFTFDGTVHLSPQPGDKPEEVEMFSLLRDEYRKQS